MKLIYLLGASFVIASFSNLFSQEITFSGEETFPNGIISIFPNSSSAPESKLNDNYFVVTGSTGVLKLNGTSKKMNEKEQESEIAYYENNVLLSKSKLNLETPTGQASFMLASSFQAETIIILRQTDKEYSRCYYQIYDNTCKSVSGPVLISERKLKEGFFGIYSCEISDNNQFISLEYLQINSKNIFDREVSYEIMDRKFNSLDNGSFKLIGVQPEDIMIDRIVCNDGSLLIGVGKQRLDDKGRETKYLDQCTVFIKRLRNPSASLEYKIPYAKVSQVSMFVSEQDNDMLYLAGMGSDEVSKVAFYVKYDLKDSRELSNVKNRVNFETFMFQPQRIFEQDNGVIFITERIYGGASTTMSVNTGTASTTPKDYFRTVLCFKVEEGSENVPWNTTIDKEQVFLTSLGLSHFGSIQVVNSKDNCFIFFNDNVSNYNDQGDYTATEKTLHDFDGKQEKKLWLDHYGVAMVNLNLRDGGLKRSLIVRNKGIVKPGGFDTFVSNSHSTLFFLQKGEFGQFGLIKF